MTYGKREGVSIYKEEFKCGSPLHKKLIFYRWLIENWLSSLLMVWLGLQFMKEKKCVRCVVVRIGYYNKKNTKQQEILL